MASEKEAQIDEWGTRNKEKRRRIIQRDILIPSTLTLLVNDDGRVATNLEKVDDRKLVEENRCGNNTNVVTNASIVDKIEEINV